jgi:CheY-like chemotaxis protein
MSKNSVSKILIVDDNDDIREMLALLLEMQGYKVVVAADGEQAVVVAERERPELILMDIMMPHLNGLEAARRIRQNPELAQVPIIGISAFSDQPTQSEADPEAFGWSAWLRKPIDMDELEQLLTVITCHT